MAKQSYYCVARCKSDGTLSWQDSEMLDQFAREEVAKIQSIKNLRRQAQRAILLGDTCCASGHPMKAVRIWIDALRHISQYDDLWLDIPINTDLTSWDMLVSQDEALQLAKRIDTTCIEIGMPHLAWWRHAVKSDYRDKWLDKYYEALPD